MKPTRLAMGIVLALALTTNLACSTAPPTATPGVERIGGTILHYRGPELDVVLSYRFANSNPGEDWLFLDVGITAETRDSGEGKRGRSAVRPPPGATPPVGPP